MLLAFRNAMSSMGPIPGRWTPRRRCQNASWTSKRSLHKNRDWRTQVCNCCHFHSAVAGAFVTHNPEFSPLVLIESMRTKQQAWHVDTPIPHVFVNFLYLSSGHSMTLFMVPKSAAGNSFSISLEELAKKPFRPVAKKAEIHAEWTVYIRER